MKSVSRTVVVGLDGSPEALEALSWARRQSGPDDRIVVVRAWDVPMAIGYDIVVAIDTEGVAQGVKQDMAETVDAIGDDRLVPVVLRGRPGPVIVAEAESADLVVVGHRGDSRISLMLGSTANYVAHHVNCPIVIVRGASTGQVRRVVVGVDEDVRDATSVSARALRWAYGVAGVEEISVVHAWETPAIALGLYGGVAVGPDAFEAAAATVVDAAIEAAGVPPAGVMVHRTVRRGSSSAVLASASIDADLVVLGSRGRGGFAELMLGSTCAALSAHSGSPVAIVR